VAELTGILFDLDGTLLDTLPDLAYALNSVLIEEGRQPLPAGMIKPAVSYGAPGMVRLAFGESQDQEVFAKRMAKLRETYSDHVAERTRLFEGMDKVLEEIENRGLVWGIVTNKRRYLTEPLLEQLGLNHRVACVIAGDDTVKGKPHPEPLWTACQAMNISPAHCVYVGDHARDIEAGKRAGMGTLAAAYGYLAPDEDPFSWGADEVLQTPNDLLKWLS